PSAAQTAHRNCTIRGLQVLLKLQRPGGQERKSLQRPRNTGEPLLIVAVVVLLGFCIACDADRGPDRHNRDQPTLRTEPASVASNDPLGIRSVVVGDPAAKQDISTPLPRANTADTDAY